MVSSAPVWSTRSSVRTAISETVEEILSPEESEVYDYVEPETQLGRSWVFGADERGQLEYMYRCPRNRHSEKTYLYSSSYGWSFEFDNVNDLLREAFLLRRVFRTAVENDELSQEQLDKYNESINDARAFQKEYTLSDVLELLSEAEWTESGPNEKTELLESLLVTDGDDDFSRFWTLLFTKQEDESGEETTVRNDYTIEYHGDCLVFIRAVRDFGDETSPVGFILGVDDTPEKFFLHRIRTSRKLRDPKYNWTRECIRSELGFIHDAEHDDDIDGFPTGEPVRIQGDLKVTRYDETDFRQSVIDERLEVALWSELNTTETVEEFKTGDWGAGEKYAENTDQLRFNPLMELVARRWGNPRKSLSVVEQNLDTDKLKDLQERHNVSEELVRERQQRRGWMRFTAARRGELVCQILNERVIQDAERRGYIDISEIRKSVTEEVSEELLTDEQVNVSIGNHSVSLAPGTDVTAIASAIDHQSSEGRSVFFVEDDSTLLLTHNEHENKVHKLEKGVYAFDFLDGFLTLEERNLPPSVISDITS